MLDNREMAILVWLLIVLVAILAHRPTRVAFKGIFGDAVNLKLLIPFGAMALWVALVVVAGHWAGAWTADTESLPRIRFHR